MSYSYGELKDKLVNGNRIAKFRVLMASAFKPYTYTKVAETSAKNS